MTADMTEKGSEVGVEERIVKIPGILYRVSFLVVLHSLLIFAAVTYVSIENNQNRIDRLIAFRFDFVSEYFRAELEAIRPAGDSVAVPGVVDAATVGSLFHRSQKYMKGLAGLALLTPTTDSIGYQCRASVLADTLRTTEPQALERIVAAADRNILSGRGIQVGNIMPSAAGPLKTIYVPWAANNANQILAITFQTSPITGGDYQYNYTIIVLFLAITLITLLILSLIFHKFIRPLKHLIFGMEKTTEGEVLYTIEDVKNDDVGRVASAFNTMSHALWDKRQQLTASNRDLRLSNRRLTEALGDLSAANASLAESQEFMSRLIENAPFGVVVTSPDGAILILSQAAATMFGCRSRDTIGHSFVSFFPFAPEKVFPEGSQTADADEVEMICLKSNGESFPALVNRVPIREEGGKLRAYLFILRDISESRGFQEMMMSIDRMITRGVMAGEVVHEINNYLAVILGNVELLPLFLAKGDMVKVDKKLEVLKNSVARIQRFSEGLVGYGNEEAVFEPGDLNQNIENLVAFLKPQNRYDGITFQMELSRSLPLIYFDNSQLQQMLINLLNNAADALREKPTDRRIRITTEAVADGQAVQISIEDNAAGLPADLAEIIFTKRYTGRRRGRGFGLMVVKQILDRHQGAIDYHSIPGVGTTFSLRIPVRNEAASSEGAADAATRQVNA